MTDIVERLRELEAVESELACECDCPPEATANYRYAMTCAEAADLITALRADNERLRAALASIDELLSQAAQDDCENGVKWLNERAAERYLATYPHTSAAILYAHKVARAALAQGGEK